MALLPLLCPCDSPGVCRFQARLPSCAPAMVCVRYCCRSAEGVARETVQLPASCLTQTVAAVRAAAASMLGLAPAQIGEALRSGWCWVGAAVTSARGEGVATVGWGCWLG